MAEDIDAFALLEALVSAAERDGWRVRASAAGISCGFPTHPAPADGPQAIEDFTLALTRPDIRAVVLAFLTRTGRVS